MEVTETLLPGVGLRYELQTAAGDRLAVVAHRSGRFELALYSERDPDAAAASFSLSEHEADVVAEILGATRIAERFADLTREIPGLMSAQVEVAPGSRFDGGRLADSRCRTLTGASIVAVVRGEEVIASPGPDQPLAGGDVLVAIGTEEGLTRVREIFGR